MIGLEFSPGGLSLPFWDLPFCIRIFGAFSCESSHHFWVLRLYFWKNTSIFLNEYVIDFKWEHYNPSYYCFLHSEFSRITQWIFPSSFYGFEHKLWFALPMINILLQSLSFSLSLSLVSFLDHCSSHNVSKRGIKRTFVSWRHFHGFSKSKIGNCFSWGDSKLYAFDFLSR